MKNFCDRCQVPTVKGQCPECHAKVGRPQPQAKEYKPHALRSRQCDFKTGLFQCQWGQYVRHDGTVYCPFHDRAIKEGIVKPSEQWDLLQKEREYMHEHYPFESFLSGEDLHRFSQKGSSAVQDPPVWYLPIEEQWKMLTGLPVPIHRPGAVKVEA